MLAGVVRRRSLDEPREEAGLRRAEVRRRDAEVALARGPRSVRALAEVDAVEIRVEDLRLAVAVLQLERRVLELAPRRPVVAVEVEELGDLLGDRARALRERDVRRVVRQGAEDADDIDAVMPVEALVLGRDDGVLQRGRDRAQRHGPP